jgi:hypothetical protein
VWKYRVCLRMRGFESWSCAVCVSGLCGLSLTVSDGCDLTLRMTWFESQNNVVSDI